MAMPPRGCLVRPSTPSTRCFAAGLPPAGAQLAAFGPVRPWEVVARAYCRTQISSSSSSSELNKFDRMMGVLHEEVPDFCQLVAVDRDFAVFSRIWCVAELVQAHSAGMPQHVQLHSCRGLRDDAQDLSLYVRLATLTVARAEATRPEDRDEILAKIPSIPEFDAQLQALIFGRYGLLQRRFVGFGAVEAAVSIARRTKALAGRSAHPAERVEGCE